ncbi:GGDEF domain-containing protein [Candidatus Reidiella endopervernicosa]|nr:GGDEF domain-containing protein [Candidatus Reidiella endopervernicosa]QKQ25821.1 GGDEF domain-containing protein [Candidatus Reidiella endopervernicosa]
MIAISSDITDEVVAKEHDLRVNIVYAVVAFILIEVMLFFGINFATRKLQEVIEGKVSHIEELNEYLEEQAVTDGLTGLHNHRFFIERLGEEMHRAQRSCSPLTLLMVDLDHFKQVNDTHGHLVGDAVLEESARVIRKHMRIADEAGRYGGEEFSVALPDTDLEGGEMLAERLLQSLREMSITLPDGSELLITASVGVAQWNGREEISMLIDHADKALYEAKRSGRNRVCRVEM